MIWQISCNRLYHHHCLDNCKKPGESDWQSTPQITIKDCIKCGKHNEPNLEDPFSV